MNLLTMTQLGRMGRFANQVLQYTFLRLYAQQYKCLLELPPWVGNELFGTDEPPITALLPQGHERWNGSHLDEHVPPKGDEFVNHDWVGYGQYHTSYYRPHKNQIRGFFQLLHPIRDPIDAGVLKLRRMGHTVIGLHRRVGDFGRLSFHLTPVEWYRKWLKENWKWFRSPVLFVATEDRSWLDDIREWSPLTTDDLEIDLAESRAYYNYLQHDLDAREPWQMDFVPDWYLLTQCDSLVISNSTFGFTAAMMNENLKELWRSSLPHGYFEQIDPWDSRPFRTERCEDPKYAHLKGISVSANPYW